MEALLTVGETMQALHISRTTIYEMFRRGVLPRIRIPGVVAVRVPRSAVQAILDSAPAAPPAAG